MIGKGLSITLAQGRRATGVDATGAQGIKEITHIQTAANILGIEQFASGAEGQRAFFDGLGCQGNITGDDQIPGDESFDDLIVGHIETGH